MFYPFDKSSPKLKCFRQLIIQVRLMLLNAFSKSEKKIRPGLLSSSALSIISKSRQMFSPVYLPFINLSWSYVYKGSYMSVHVLLNLLNELGKRDKMRGLPSILSLFRNEFNKFNNTRARILDSIYHMTLRLL